jgi:hypothetical protein
VGFLSKGTVSSNVLNSFKGLALSPSPLADLEGIAVVVGIEVEVVVRLKRQEGQFGGPGPKNCNARPESDRFRHGAV